MKFYLFLTISILFRVSRQITSQFLTFLGFFHWITQEKIENILNLQRTLQKTPDSSPQMMTPDSDSLFQKVPNESGVKSHNSWFVHSLDYITFIRYQFFDVDDPNRRARSQDANLREEPHRQDHHLGGGALRHHRECQGQDPGKIDTKPAL